MNVRWKRLRRLAVVPVAAVALLVANPVEAFAGPQKVCNASFCNATKATGPQRTQVVATKIGLNRGSIGYFEAFGPGGVHQRGYVSSYDTTGFELLGPVKKGQLVCLRYFVKILSTGQFRELGSAQCATAPF